MTRTPLSPPRLAAVLALLALATGARLRAAEAAAPGHDAPAPHAEPAHAPATAHAEPDHPAPAKPAPAEPAPATAHAEPTAESPKPAAEPESSAHAVPEPPPFKAPAAHDDPATTAKKTASPAPGEHAVEEHAPAEHAPAEHAPVEHAPAPTDAKTPPASAHAPAKPAAKDTAHAPAPKAAKGAHGPEPKGAAKEAHPALDPHAVPPKSARPGLSAEEIQSLIKLGGLMTDRANYESAEIAFYQVLNNPGLGPADTKSALLGLARMHRKQGSLTKASAIYERFLKDYPNDERTPDALLDLGRTLRALGVYKGAISRFYSVINSTLKLPGEGFEHYQILTKTAQFEIAETHFQAGDFAEAAKFYSRLRLLDLAPADRARAHFKAAYSTRLKGDREGAITTLRAYIDQWPEDDNVPEARYLLAVTLRELKRTEEAFVATLELLRTEQSRVVKDPKRWAYWQRRTGNQLANDFFETGNILNAQAIYSGLVDLSPEPAWRLPLTYQIALCHERLGTTDRARAAYQSIVEAAGATPPPELAELARMAAWRLNHLSWRDGVTKQVSSFFETTTGKASPSPTPAADPVSGPKPMPATATLPPATAPANAAPTTATPAPATPAPATQAPTAAAASGAKTASLP